MYRVGSGLIHCATRVVPKHVDQGRGNTPLNVTLMQPAYRPSDSRASSAVGIKIHSAVSCRPRHGVALSSAITTIRFFHAHTMLLARGMLYFDRYYSRVLENMESSIALLLQLFGCIACQSLLRRPHSEATFRL